MKSGHYIILASVTLLLVIAIVNMNSLMTTKELHEPVQAAPVQEARAPTPAPAVTGPSEEIKAEFKADRAHIMSMLRQFVDKKYFTGAVAWGERFKDIDDAEFQKLYNQALAGNGQQQTEMAAKMAEKERRRAAFNANPEAASLSAIRFCKDAVKRELKAPASADFEFMPKVERSDINETYMISSYVDAINSFGAKVRTNFFCQLNFIDGQTWTLKELRVVE